MNDRIPAELAAYYELASWLTDRMEGHVETATSVDSEIRVAMRIAWNTGESLIRCKRIIEELMAHCEDYILLEQAERELGVDLRQ